MDNEIIGKIASDLIKANNGFRDGIIDWTNTFMDSLGTYTHIEEQVQLAIEKKIGKEIRF